MLERAILRGGDVTGAQKNKALAHLLVKIK